MRSSGADVTEGGKSNRSGAAGFAPAAQRVAIVSQGLGWIVPPRAEGSISIWTYEVARRFGNGNKTLLIELGNQRFGLRWARYEALTLVYVPDFANRIANGLHRRLRSLIKKVVRLPLSRQRPEHASAFLNFVYALKAAWRARRWKADVIHVHNFSQFVPVIRAVNPKARIVLHMNCEWLSQLDAEMIRRRLESVDLLFAASVHVAQRITRVFPEWKDRLEIVYNGADVQALASRISRASGEHLRMLFVGRLSPEKGIHNLIAAFTKVAPEFPAATLEFVGPFGSLPADFLVGLSDDPWVKPLERFYGSDYGDQLRAMVPPELAHRVVFHGGVPHGELAEHYGRASVFVNASLSDAFPLPVVEAMAAGLPVIASAVGGIPEAVQDGETGWLIRPDDVEGLATAMRRLLASDELRERTGSLGRKRALEMFAWEVIAKRTETLYAREFVPVVGRVRRVAVQ